MMKRFICLLLFLILVFSLSGCGSYTEKDLKAYGSEKYEAGYDNGYKEARSEYYDEGYSYGYDDGWSDAMRRVADEKLEQGDRDDALARHVEAELLYIIDSLADYGCYNDEEYCYMINDLIRYVEDYKS